jgi:hypothetical protein
MNNNGYPPPPGGYGYGQSPPAGGYGAPPGQPGYGGYGGGYGPPNPYAAPVAPVPMTAWSGNLAAPGGNMKWLFIAGYAGYWIVNIGTTVVAAVIQSNSSGSDTAAFASMLPLLSLVPIMLVPIAGLVWLYKSWACIPPEMRYTDGGKWVTPGAAVGFLFVPFYNLYWVFVANMGLCEAINRSLITRGGAPRAPKGLAIACCIVNIVPYCNLLAGPIMWLVFMFMLDGPKKELVNRTGAVTY